jgi:cell division protein FtsI/penicillin-binding protein 2
MLGRTDRRWRSVAILLLMGAFAFVAVLRLAYWQVAMASDLQKKAQPQLTGTTTEPPARGRILDRNGVPLATTGYRDTLVGYPDTITREQRVATVAALATILDLDGTARAVLDSKLSSNAPYAPLRRGLNAEQSKAIRAGISAEQLHGVQLLPQLVRVYPQEGGQPGTTLASQLLGFVSSDEQGSHGIYGIEQEYDTTLAGGSGNMAAAIGSGSGLTDSSALVGGPGGDGRDITISIDSSLQLQLEKELYSTLIADKATRVSGLIMDPTSGAILAWASVPGYDANDGGNVAQRDPQLVQDPIVSLPYEPGSVMKMLTATSALENKVVTLNTRILDSADIWLAGQRVRNSDHLGNGRIPVQDVIAYSRNVAVSRIALRLGKTTQRAAVTLYKTWHKMGIGVPTGVDVPGEAAGVAHDPRLDPWMPIDLANHAFGQGVMVTPVQLAKAFTPMINGGMIVQPHFLVSVGDQQQAVTPGTRVLTRKVAGQLQGILHHVTSAVWWYAKGSLIPGYQVGGKTGTAQIWNPNLWNPTTRKRGDWDHRYFNFSFVGYVGGDSPAAVVAIHIEHAKSLTKKQGDFVLNRTSYELFRRVAIAIIDKLHVPRSRDPHAGQPEPGSGAEKFLEPLRYYRRTHPAGHGR